MSKFYLFGTPIAHSLSPLVHNKAFESLGLPYRYFLNETSDVEAICRILKDKETLGCSVTIPNKQTVMNFLDYVSDTAEKIGAVNTIVKDEFGDLHGDNTDWIAIYSLIEKVSQESFQGLENLSPIGSQYRALVVGAGGMSSAVLYALKELGVKTFIWNRNAEKARNVAQRFDVQVVEDVESLDKIDIVVSTVPPSAQLVLPENLLHRQLIVVEAVYYPRYTSLLRQALDANCLRIVEGIEILFEQAIHQLKLFVRNWVDLDASPLDRRSICEIANAIFDSYDNGSLRQNRPLLLSKYIDNPQDSH